jgi:HK97 family phage major capsid protein
MTSAQARLHADLDKLKNELRSTVDMTCENDAETAARTEEIGKLTKAIEARSAELDTETAAAEAIAKVEARKLSVNSAGMVVAQRPAAPAVRAIAEPSALVSRAGFRNAEEMRSVGAAIMKLYRREIAELRAAPVASTHPIGGVDTVEPDSMGEKSPLYDGRGSELVLPLFYNAILNLISYQSVATRVARMLEVRGPKMHVQTGDDIQEAAWYLENCEILPIKPKTVGAIAELHKLGARVQVSNELMEDSLYSIVDLVARTFANGFAKKLDKTFFGGDTSIGFAGLVPSIAAGNTVTAAGATPTLAEITSLMAKVDPMAMNRAWVISDAGWAAVQGLATASIGTNVTTAIEQRIFGAPVFVSHDLPAKTLALYGDFQMAAAIGYHPNGLVIRSSYERAIEYDQWVAVATARYGFALTGAKYVAALKTA